MTTYDALGLPIFETTDKIAASGDGLREDLNLIGASVRAAITAAKWDKGALNTSTDLNTLTTPGVYRADTSTIANSVLNKPVGTSQPFEVVVEVLSITNGIYKQTLTEWSAAGPIESSRVSLSGTFQDWAGVLANGASLNTLTRPGTYRADTSTIAKSIVGIPTGTTQPFSVEVRKVSNANGIYSQTLTEYGANGPIISRRLSLSGTYAASWQPEPNWDKGALANGANLNTLTTPGVYWADTSTIAKSVVGIPVGTSQPFTVEVRKISGTNGIYLQTLTEYGSNGPITSRRSSLSNTYAAWIGPDMAANRARATTLGDSLTEGGDKNGPWAAGEDWPSQLATTLGITVSNYGHSGDTTDELMVRVGIHKVYFKVAGGSIPASGGVTVTTPQVFDFTTTNTFTGTLAGIAGTLTWATGAWTFTRDAAGTATAVSGEALFIPVQAGREGDTLTVWIGRNDLSFGTAGMERTIADHVVGNIGRILEWAAPRMKNVVIFGVTNATTEAAGSAEFAAVQEINTRLQSMYPGKFNGVQNYLVNKALSDMGLTPTAADTAAISDGRIPPQLYASGDPIHFSKATATALANKFAAPYMRGKGWVA